MKAHSCHRAFSVFSACILGLTTILFMGCRSDPPLNLLIITMDTTRADHLGAYGRENAGTPNIDWLAQHGFVFEQAYSAAPITLPAHSTLFTGRYPIAHGVRDNGIFSLPAEETTLAERLQAAGYSTGAAIGSFPLTRGFGIDQGFDFFDDHITINAEDFRGNRVEAKRGLYFDERSSAQVNDVILPWLRNHSKAPFFAWLHYWDPHQPNSPPSPLNQLYLHDLYQGEIAFSDQSIGNVLDTLREQHVLEHTIVVIVGDHGEGLGEHREQSHSMLTYNTTLHVPMIIYHPGRNGGHRLAERVGSVDLLPTLLDLLGLEVDEGIQGRSLARWMGQPEEPFVERTPHYAETLSPRLSHGWGELRVLYEGNLKYIHGPRPELYDVVADPHELHDLSVERPHEVARLHARLSTFLESRSMATSSRAAQEVDAETRQRLAALGYLSSDGADPGSVKEQLVEGGIAPRDRIRDVGLMSQAKQLLDRREFVKAREIARELTELDPRNAYYRALLATALLELGKTNQAALIIEEASSLTTQNSSVFLIVAARLFHLGERDRAVALVRRINSDADSGYGRYLLAEMLTASGRGQEAEPEFVAALELSPLFLRARLSHALLLADQGRLEEAETRFRDLLQRHPLSERGHYNLGVLLLKADRWDEALAQLDRAIDLAPRYWPPHLARLALYVDRGQEPEAEAAVQFLERNCQDKAVVSRAQALRSLS